MSHLKTGKEEEEEDGKGDADDDDDDDDSAELVDVTVLELGSFTVAVLETVDAERESGLCILDIGSLSLLNSGIRFSAKVQFSSTEFRLLLSSSATGGMVLVLLFDSLKQQFF